MPQGHVLPTLQVAAPKGPRDLQQVGSYEVVKPVCDDKNARLHLAKNKRIGRLVTLQEITLPDPADTAGAVQWVEKANKAERQRGAHFVEIHDFLEQTHSHYCAVMEPLFGETLRSRISRRTLKLDEAVELVHEIAQGLAVLHKAGRVHGGLTSSWVFLAEGERGARKVKLIDYGPGAEHSALLELEAQAPEQRSRAPPTALTDIYFLASLLFEMLHVKRPYELAEPGNQSAAGEPIPPSLQAVIAQALNPNPVRRYRNLDVFCAAVLEGLNAASVRAPEPKKRNLGPVFVGAGVVVVLAGVGLLWPKSTPKPLPPPPMEVKHEAPRVEEPEVPSLPPYGNLFIGGALKEAAAVMKPKKRSTTE